MLDNFKIHSNSANGLTSISAKQASELITKYNIYFKYEPIPQYAKFVPSFDITNKFTTVYKLDSLISFDSQFKSIKSLTLLDQSTVYFFTDHKSNKDLVTKKLELAHQLLLSNQKSITLTNMKKESKLKDTDIKKYISSLEPYQTQSLFEVVV